jgi:large repetitive protein
MKAAFNSIVPFRRRRPLKAAAGAALLVVVVVLGVQFVLAAPPEPSFTVSNATPLIGETMNFSSTTTDPDGDGEAGGVAWDFDYDGTTFTEDATGPTPSTSYTSPGTRTVAMRVTDGTVNDDTAQTVMATNPVTVTNSLPNASFTASPNPAQLGQTVNFNGAASDDPDPGGSITTYEWDLDGDGSFETNTGGTATTSRTYNAPAQLTVRLRVTDNNGDSGETTGALRINAPPTAQIGAPGPAVPDPGEQISFSASGSSDSDGSISSYQWDFNYDGTFNAEASGQTTTHSYPTAGNKTIRLRVTDNDGATGEVGLALRVNAAPTAEIATPTPAVPDPNEQVAFSATGSSDGDGTITTYEWDFDFDGTTFTVDATGPSPNHTYATAGNRTIRLRVTDNDGATAVTNRALRVNAPPTPAFTFAGANPVTPTVPDVGETVNFSATATTDDQSVPASGFDWEFDGDNDFNDAQGPTASHIFATAGVKTVRLRVTDSDGTSRTADHQVRVNSPPTAIFNFTPTAPRAGQPIGFDGADSNDAEGAITTANHAWDFDYDGTTFTVDATGTNPIHTYPTAGFRTVRLRVIDTDGATHFSNKTVDVAANGAPSANFIFTPERPTPGQAVAFASTATDPDGNQTITTFEWDLDDDNVFGEAGEVGPSVSHAFPTAGVKNVRLRVTDDGGLSNTVTKQVTVNAVPIANFTFAGQNPVTPGVPDINEQITLDGSSSTDAEPGQLAYAWDLNNDGTFGDKQGAQVTHSFGSAGTKIVGLKVTDADGAASTVTKTLRVNAPPTVAYTFAGQNPVTPGVPDPNEQVTFTSTSTDPEETVTHAWDLDNDNQFDDGTAATATFTYPTAGNKTVRLRVTDSDGSVVTLDRVVRVNTLPVADFTFAGQNPITPAVPDIGEQINFNAAPSSDAEGALASFAWDLDGDTQFDDGTGPQITQSFATRGTKTVGLRVTDSDGTTRDVTRTLRVNAPPTVTPASLGYAVPPPTATPPGPLEAGQNPLVPIIGQRVDFVGPAPDSPATDPEVVQATPATHIPNANYKWDLDSDGVFGEAAGPNQPNEVGRAVNRSFDTAGSKPVKLRVTDLDLSTTEAPVAPPVHVNTRPTANFISSNPRPITDEKFTLSSTSTDADDNPATPVSEDPLSYAWDLDNDGQFDDSNAPVVQDHSFATAGAKTVKLRVTDSGGAAAVATTTVNVANTRPAGGFDFSPSDPLPGQVVTFDSRKSTPTAGKQITQVEWDFDYDPGAQTFTPDATGATAGHAFPSPGQKTVAVRVTETGGGDDVEQGTLTVNAPPQASFNIAPPSPFTGDTVTFSSTSSDPDGSFSQAWDTDNDGQFDDSAGAVASRSFGSPGPYTVRLLVVDSKGATSVATGRVDVRARPVPPPQPAPPPPPLRVLAGVTTRIAGGPTKNGALIRALTVRAPKGATVTAICKGRHCPAKKKVVRSKGRLLHLRAFERRLRAGTKISVSVTLDGFIGKQTVFTIRRGKAPKRVDLCLQPGAKRPSACPPS